MPGANLSYLLLLTHLILRTILGNRCHHQGHLQVGIINLPKSHTEEVTCRRLHSYKLAEFEFKSWQWSPEFTVWTTSLYCMVPHSFMYYLWLLLCYNDKVEEYQLKLQGPQNPKCLQKKLTLYLVLLKTLPLTESCCFVVMVRRTPGFAHQPHRGTRKDKIGTFFFIL